MVLESRANRAALILVFNITEMISLAICFINSGCESIPNRAIVRCADCAVNCHHTQIIMPDSSVPKRMLAMC